MNRYFKILASLVLLLIFLILGREYVLPKVGNAILKNTISYEGTREKWESKVSCAVWLGADDSSLYTELLFKAVSYGDLEIFKEGMDHGGNINSVRRKDNDNTVLHYTAIYASSYPMCGLIQYIHTKSNDLVSVQNVNGETPLDIAKKISGNDQNSRDARECFNRLH